MDYEKAYNEALKRARDYSEGHSLDVNPQAAMAYVFPELKENKDEKIRKAIVELVKQSSHILNPMNQKSMIAWLEKQKKGVESWPNLTNCKHDCKSCIGKCFYRKEPYQGEKPAEWTEEEKSRIDKIIDVLDWAEEKGRINYTDWGDYVTYVKSLKPQPKKELDEEKLKDEIDKAAADWDNKAYFSPIAMVMDDSGRPCDIEQYETTHGDSFKAGVEWIIKKLKEFES